MTAGINAEARKVQVELFDELIKKSFEQLRNMPSERFVPLSKNIRGATVCVRKRELNPDEIEIEVELRQRFLLLFHGVLRKSFRVNSSGEISDREYETYRSPSSDGTELQYGELPRGVEHDVVAYLRKEFGEHEGMTDALQVNDLHYAGAFRKGKAIIHCWRVNAERPLWATVSDESGSLHFSITSKNPSESLRPA